MNYKEEIKEICHANPEEEECGFIVLDQGFDTRIIRARNVHENKSKYFKIPLNNFLEIDEKYNILCIYHSHPQTSESPSKFDIKVAEEMCLPFLIYSLKSKKFFLHFPTSFTPDKIIGRMYVEDIHECTCLVKDYYLKELGINITGWIKNYCIPRNNKKANKLLTKVFSKNLIEVNEPKKHDILVFKFSDKKMLHAGIYIGEERFIHQKNNQISSRTFLDSRWKDKIYKIYRHPSLV
jgi:proteasome lid subunit RPN8/RPN11